MSKKLSVTFSTNFDTYNGGKSASGVPQFLINHIPQHKVFVSGFLGNCAVMQYKEPALINVGIDRDENVIKNWHKDARLTLIKGSFLQYGIQYLIGKDNFIFLDPPYLFSTRKQQRDLYNYEMNEKDHIELLELIKNATANVMLCCYPNELYKEYLPDWTIISYKGRDRSGKVREEWIMINYPKPKILHDWRYVGKNHRKRDDLKDKIDRLMCKFDKMPPLERNKILHLLNKKYAADNGIIPVTSATH